MQPIPAPELLDPDRIRSDERENMILEDHRDRAQRLGQALHDSCAYATQLWEHLDKVRGYLYDSLPTDPRGPDAHPRAGAAPTGPDDDTGWQRWIDAYSAVTSVLAGPHGDSGFGFGEAQAAARLRRDAPNLAVLTSLEAARPKHADPEPAGSQPTEPAAPVDAPSSALPSTLRSLAFGALVALALRGLRPGQRRPARRG